MIMPPSLADHLKAALGEMIHRHGAIFPMRLLEF